MIAVMPEVLASWKFSPTRNGIQEIAASGASNPARVRTWAQIGAAMRTSEGRRLSGILGGGPQGEQWIGVPHRAAGRVRGIAKLMT